MPLTPYPHGISSFGIPVLPSASERIRTGDVYFVDSNTGTTGSDADSPDNPVSTWDGAVNLCTANNGDLIVLMEGHSETISGAAGVDLDVAGVTSLGLGVGASRPTFTFTATGADIDFDAASQWVENILLLGGVDATTGIVDINAADCTLKDIEYRDDTGQATDVIMLDANADRCTINGLQFYGSTADGGDSAINIVGSDRTVIENFVIKGNFDQGAIENVSTACTNLLVRGGYIENYGSEDLAIVAVSTSSGDIGPHIYIRIADDTDNITECISASAMQIFDPIYVCNGDGERGLQYNGTASADST